MPNIEAVLEAVTSTGDPATQIGVLSVLLTTVAAIVGGAVKLMRDGRKREAGQESMLEQQRVELLDPLLKELARVRKDRDRAWLDRGVLIAVCLEHSVPIPPEVFQ